MAMLASSSYIEGIVFLLSFLLRPRLHYLTMFERMLVYSITVDSDYLTTIFTDESSAEMAGFASIRYAHFSDPAIPNALASFITTA